MEQENQLIYKTKKFSTKRSKSRVIKARTINMSKEDMEKRIVERLISKEQSGRFIQTDFIDYNFDHDRAMLKRLKDNLQKSNQLTYNVVGFMIWFVIVRLLRLMDFCLTCGRVMSS